MKLFKIGILMFLAALLVSPVLVRPVQCVDGLCGPKAHSGFYDGSNGEECYVDIWDCPGYTGVYNYQGLHNGNTSYYEDGEATPLRIFIVDPEGNVRIAYVS